METKKYKFLCSGFIIFLKGDHQKIYVCCTRWKKRCQVEIERINILPLGFRRRALLFHFLCPHVSFYLFQGHWYGLNRQCEGYSELLGNTLCWVLQAVSLIPLHVNSFCGNGVNIIFVYSISAPNVTSVVLHDRQNKEDWLHKALL